MDEWQSDITGAKSVWHFALYLLYNLRQVKLCDFIHFLEEMKLKTGFGATNHAVLSCIRVLRVG